MVDKTYFYIFIVVFYIIIFFCKIISLIFYSGFKRNQKFIPIIVLYSNNRFRIAIPKCIANFFTNDYIGIKPTGNEGNVLIGIYDATAGEPTQDAKPLWSWHIWITDYNPGGDINGIIPAISQNPGKADVTGGAIYRFGGIDNNQTKDGSTQAMMDRNLGALSATPTDGAKTIGMYYQCGRKDPILTDWSQITKLGTSSLGGDVYSIHIKTAKGPVSKETAVKNPDTYFLGDADHFTYKDWLI